MNVFLSGPNATITVWVLHISGVENIIEKLCHLTGDDEYEYTATIL